LLLLNITRIDDKNKNINCVNYSCASVYVIKLVNTSEQTYITPNFAYVA